MKAAFAAACACLIGISSAQNCNKDALHYPNVFGAEVTALDAHIVRNWTLTVTSPEGKLIPSGGLSFCNVTVLYHHPGQDDPTNVQVWLPLEGWNERFVGVGGGGFAVGKLNGEPLAATVNLGYAGTASFPTRHAVKP
jgi:hypothetical protein